MGEGNERHLEEVASTNSEEPFEEIDSTTSEEPFDEIANEQAIVGMYLIVAAIALLFANCKFFITGIPNMVFLLP